MNDSPAAPASLSSVRDFPDRLSPVLVKELRQGLRAKYFVEFTVGFHGLLWVIMATDSQEQAGTRMTWLMWWMFSAFMIFILPLRGLSALVDERRGDTLDCLVLTNLTAGRIIRGKWLAIAAQITLVAVSVIPYVLMMYFSRSLPLAELMLTLFRLWLTGLLLTALFVSFSWHSSWLIRSGLALLLAPMVIAGHLVPLLAQLINGQPMTGGEVLLWWSRQVPSFGGMPGAAVSEAIGMTVTGLVFLEATATRLAPEENHSTAPRVAALALTVLTLASSGDSIYGITLRTLWLVTALIVSLFALTDQFRHRPGPGRPASGSGSAFGSRLPWWTPLSPGQPQGVLFACLVWSLAISVIATGSHPVLEFSVHRLAAWLFSTRLLLWLMPGSGQSGPGRFLVAGLILTLIHGSVQLAGNLLGGNDAWLSAAAFIPSPLALLAPDQPDITVMVAWTAMLLCALNALRLLRTFRRGNPPTAVPFSSPSPA
ncbi:MAG: hypothetical protein JWM59_3357 [Verrucomicrobiales bacterium]|nr:hypothetical protein [Verrucomicrobiales bacterium]